MTKERPASRHHRLQAAYLARLPQVGPFVEGSLCAYRRAGRTRDSWLLTYKLDGKTRTVYVPVDMVEEVRRWTKAYRRLKELVRKETEQSLAIIRRHSARRQAASRKPASTPTRRPPTPSA